MAEDAGRSYCPSLRGAQRRGNLGHLRSDALIRSRTYPASLRGAKRRGNLGHLRSDDWLKAVHAWTLDKIPTGPAAPRNDVFMVGGSPVWIRTDGQDSHGAARLGMTCLWAGVHRFGREDRPSLLSVIARSEATWQSWLFAERRPHPQQNLSYVIARSEATRQS